MCFLRRFVWLSVAKPVVNPNIVLNQSGTNALVGLLRVPVSDFSAESGRFRKETLISLYRCCNLANAPLICFVWVWARLNNSSVKRGWGRGVVLPFWFWG